MTDYPVRVYPAKILFSYNPRYFNMRFDMGLGLTFRSNMNMQVLDDVWEDWELGSEEYRRSIKHYIVQGIRNLVVQIEVIGLLGREVGILEIPLAKKLDGEERTFHGFPLMSYSDFLFDGMENQWNLDRIPEFENLNSHYHL